MSSKVRANTKRLFWLALVIFCGWFSGFRISALMERGGEFFTILEKMFPPDWSYAASILSPLWQTVQMSVAGTFLGAVLALPMAAVCSAAVTARPRLSAVLRAVVNVVRSIPVLILALTASFLLGIGTLAGTAAICVYSFGILSRITWEEMDHADLRPLETLAASGCSRGKAFCRTVLVQVFPGFQANVLYVLESNVRHAAILGYVGAGGLGILLNEKIAWREYARVGMMLLLLYAVVLLIEGLSTRCRSVLLGVKTGSRAERRCVIALLAVLTVLSFLGLSTQGVSRAGLTVFGGILRGLLTPDWSLLLSLAPTGVPYLLLETVCMAVTGTVIGALVSVPLAFFGCRRICGAVPAALMKLLSAAVRTMPAVIYGLLFLRVTGPGAFAGLMTFAALSVGMCTKLFISALDNLDYHVVDALSATGCSRLAVLRHGVWPMVKAQFLSDGFYRFDVNLRDAAVMGLVGAGGIGAPLIFAMNNYNWSAAGAYMLGLMIVVLLADWISSHVRTNALHSISG